MGTETEYEFIEEVDSEEEEVSEEEVVAVDEDHEHVDEPAEIESDEPKMVPITALHEERERRKEISDRVQHMEAQLKKYDTLEQRLNEFQQQREQARQEEEVEPDPDFNYDPTGNLDARLRRMQEIIDKQNEQLTGVQNQTHQQRMLQQLGSAIQSREAAFQAEHTDYMNALEHVRNVERAKIEPLAKAQGYTDDQIMQHLYTQEVQAAAQLMSQGLDPAEYVYRLAKTYGYQPQEVSDDADEVGKVERLKSGHKAAKSLGSGSGGKKGITKQQLDEMDIEEFDEAISELFG